MVIGVAAFECPNVLGQGRLVGFCWVCHAGFVVGVPLFECCVGGADVVHWCGGPVGAYRGVVHDATG